jgi:signal peptidase I
VDFVTRRTIQPVDYAAIAADVRMREYRQQGIEVLATDEETVSSTPGVKYDLYERSKINNMVRHQLAPHVNRYRSEYARYTLGWLVPEGWIFPMGDNRDNSNDARYFGPVRLDNVLGKASFIYWPPSRMGAAR